MTTLQSSHTIDASATRIWEVLGDFKNVHLFHPMVKNVDQLSEVDRGMGAKRRCNFYNNSGAVEEVIEWKEGQSFTVIITDAPMPVVNTKACMSVKPIGPDKSIVTLEMTYTPKWGVFGKIFDLLVLRMAMRQVFKKVLNGLQRHIETGRDIGKGGKLLPVGVREESAH